MKFTDGYWLMRDGVQAVFPAQAYHGEVSASELTVYAPVKRIKHRGDTLNTAIVTARFPHQRQMRFGSG